ncbi:MAG: RnfABCDGE type electron transport complex subunit D [Ruminococcaceae bacterium]|nr:RnfABCDGE type electron transport complex subunit D [Oscillospiraceae bacterium]
MNKKLIVSSSPHIRNDVSTRDIMLDVIIALAPATVYGVILFGLSAALLIVSCVLAAVLSEFLWCLIMKKPHTIGDLSAVVTGLILALNLPPRLPVWMGIIGSAIAIIVVKEMFGGLGQNFANPAITARIILLVSFPAAMTTFYPPFSDVVSSATPLAAEPATYTLRELFLGTHAGSIGETSALMLLIGFAYLLVRRIISPVIPLCFIGTAALFTLCLGGNPLTCILSGGLLLGAIFMATDYVTTPKTPWGMAVFGVGCGILTVIIREFASLPEGVSYSILIMNILTPHINRLPSFKPFGWEDNKNA